MGATNSNGNHRQVTADTITSDQIRALRHDLLIDTETCWNAIYNDHTEIGRKAREASALAFNRRIGRDESIVCLEACS